MTYLKAVEAGADVIDTAISPFSGGASQPATETLDYALREMGYDTAWIRTRAADRGLLQPIRRISWPMERSTPSPWQRTPNA
jgi:pyruvate/oxaloacetate carboxyltransferase